MTLIDLAVYVILVGAAWWLVVAAFG